MENVESVSKKFQIFTSFLTKIGQKIIFRNNYLNKPLNWMEFHRLVQKY